MMIGYTWSGPVTSPSLLPGATARRYAEHQIPAGGRTINTVASGALCVDCVITATRADVDQLNHLGTPQLGGVLSP
jgi:hypothetical protein